MIFIHIPKIESEEWWYEELEDVAKHFENKNRLIGVKPKHQPDGLTHTSDPDRKCG